MNIRHIHANSNEYFVIHRSPSRRYCSSAGYVPRYSHSSDLNHGSDLITCIMIASAIYLFYLYWTYLLLGAGLILLGWAAYYYRRGIRGIMKRAGERLRQIRQKH